MRQRLTVSKGYGVSEIYIPEGSKFEGMTIQDTQLREKDINVLTLYRGPKTIPNPKASRVLEAYDKLLCFGKLEAMRGMIPAKAQKRRSPKVSDLPKEVAEMATEADVEN